MRIETQNKLATVFLGVTMTALFIILFILLYPFKIIEIVQPYKVLNPNHQVKRGEPLIYLVEYQKFTDTPAIIYRNIVCADGNLVTLAPMKSNVPRGSHTIVREDTVIPQKTSLGMCRLEVVLDYEVSHIRNIRYQFVTEEFEVLQ